MQSIGSHLQSIQQLIIFVESSKPKQKQIIGLKQKKTNKTIPLTSACRSYIVNRCSHTCLAPIFRPTAAFNFSMIQAIWKWRFTPGISNKWLSGPCLTTATWGCRKDLSQRELSFLWKLHCHWLKGMRRQITVVGQGPCYTHCQMAQGKHNCHWIRQVDSTIKSLI